MMLTRITLLASALWMASACSPEPQVSLDVPRFAPQSATTLITPHLGQWTVLANSYSDCPSQWRRVMPTGQTVWRQAGESLVIESANGSEPSAELWPADEQTLIRTMDVGWMGCNATESITLVVESRGPYWATGFFSAQLHHDGSDACEALAQHVDLPSSCETTMTWLARR